MHTNSRQRAVWIMIVAIGLAVLFPVGARAQFFWEIILLNYWTGDYDDDPWSEPQIQTDFAHDYALQLLSKARPDECYSGVRALGDLTPPTSPPCAAGTPKVNQAYVWGLTLASDKIWFGTCANVLMLVMGGYLQATNPVENESYVAEFGHSFYAQTTALPDAVGDWRPSQIYYYNRTTGTLVPIFLTMPTAALQLLAATVGIRSAGTGIPDGNPNNPVVFMGGPALSTNAAVNLFAFNGRTGQFLGAANFPGFTNIRKWRTHNGVLYTAVGNASGGGNVFRWISNPLAPGFPFAFEMVGVIDGTGAELAVHEGRLFVTTWPGAGELSALGAMAGVWMSPVIPEGGLRNAHSAAWQKVWAADDYEPDPLVARTYGGGAVESFDGWLYWGTMHVPGLSYAVHASTYGVREDEDDIIYDLLGSYRPISIFRARNFDNPAGPQIQLLYGNRKLPVYDDFWGSWDLENNNMGGAIPLMGLAGFGNFFNNYTWTMYVYKNELYVGTMDFAYLIESAGLDLPGGLAGLLLGELLDIVRHPGADLYRFPCSASNAVPVLRDGMANYSTYGIRTMESDGAKLFLGMANPMNLMTDLTDDLPEGGWELLALTKHAGCVGDLDCDGMPDDWETLYHGGVTNGTPSDDDDDDGQNNLDECTANTNPQDDTEFFMVGDGEPALLSDGVVICWDTVAGRTYSVYRAPLLGGAWTSILQGQGDGTRQCYTNHDAGTGRSFFRIGVERN